jgi:hypothetical protein
MRHKSPGLTSRYVHSTLVRDAVVIAALYDIANCRFIVCRVYVARCTHLNSLMQVTSDSLVELLPSWRILPAFLPRFTIVAWVCGRGCCEGKAEGVKQRCNKKHYAVVQWESGVSDVGGIMIIERLSPFIWNSNFTFQGYCQNQICRRHGFDHLVGRGILIATVRIASTSW